MKVITAEYAISCQIPFNLNPKLMHHITWCFVAHDEIHLQRMPLRSHQQYHPHRVNQRHLKSHRLLKHVSMRCNTQKHTTPPIKPIASAPPTVTKPAAGVITTRPATAPDAAPNTERFTTYYFFSN